MTEKISNKKLQETLRNQFLQNIKEYLENSGEDVLVTGSNELAIPTTDSEKNEQWVVIKVSIPTGSRDGSPYDGFVMAQEYIQKLTEKAEKAEKAKADKAKKIEHDKKMREIAKEKREKAKAELSA